MANNYWRDVTLKEVADVNPDSIDKKWPYDHISYIDISSVGQGYISIKPAFISLVDAPSRAKRRVRLGDTVLSTVRPNRRSMFYASDPSPDWIVSTGFAVIRPKQDMISPRYLYSCVFNQTFTDYLVAHEIGAAYPAVSVNDILNAPIHLPPRKEQDAIAGILGALDDKIELNRQMCKTLDDTAQAIFKSWFVDFDPVHAKAAGKQPQGMNPEIVALFPDSFDDSEAGQLPKGWKTGPLGHLVSLLSGYSFRSQDWVTDGIPVVKIGSVKPGIVDLKQVSFVRNDIAANAKSYQLSPGDLLIGMTGYVGEVGLVPYTPCPPLLNQRVAKFILNEPGTKNLGYIYCLTRREDFKRAVEGRSHGTAQANVSAKDILSINVTIPNDKTLQVFNAISGCCIDKILQNHLELAILQETRDLLLPNLLSGKLHVTEIESIVSRVI